jgi:hypothetical protein
MSEKLVRGLVICISFVEMVVLAGYYWPLLWGVPWMDLKNVDWRRYHNNYVSDLLFHNSFYKALVTCLVALQLCICSFFVVQLNHRYESHQWGFMLVTAMELVMLVLAWIGWVIVNSVYLDAHGHMTFGHIFGASLFISACGVFYVLMMGNVYFLYPNRWTRREWLVFGLSVLCFVASATVGCIFAASFFTQNIQFGWVFEHAAFILFMAAQIWLFVVDAWLEEDMRRLIDQRSVSGCFDSIRINKVDLRS